MTRTTTTLLTAAAWAFMALAPAPARAWDAAGHRMITWLALDGLPADAPAFLREPATRHMVGWQSAEPDRWRGVASGFLRHENAPEHYLDIEDLSQFGLTLESMPPLRARYIAAMAVSRHVHPELIGEPYNPKHDPAGDKEWPGFALHAAAEIHAKLISSFKTWRILSTINEPSRAPQLEMAKANIQVQMGLLSHIVGDLAQPLHTTRHFNGWVGDNPREFTTAKTFHAYIDGGVIAHHQINYAMLKPMQTYQAVVTDALNPWSELTAYVQRSFDQVVPLYELEKSGKLTQDQGKAAISERLHSGADMLAALYGSAWGASVIDDKAVEEFKKYDGFSPAELPADAR